MFRWCPVCESGHSVISSSTKISRGGRGGHGKLGHFLLKVPSLLPLLAGLKTVLVDVVNGWLSMTIRLSFILKVLGDNLLVGGSVPK